MSPGGVQIMCIPTLLDHQATIVRGHLNIGTLITVLTTLQAKVSPLSARTRLPHQDPLTILLKHSWYWHKKALQA